MFFNLNLLRAIAKLCLFTVNVNCFRNKNGSSTAAVKKTTHGQYITVTLCQRLIAGSIPHSVKKHVDKYRLSDL